jgi:hypothetical protein
MSKIKIGKDRQCSHFLEVKNFRVGLVYLDPWFGNHLEFYDDPNKSMVSFGWWDHADDQLRQMTLEEVPGANPIELYDYCEQGVEINIWEKKGYTFIAQGDFEEPGSFDHVYRVPTSSYLKAWQDFLVSLPTIPGTFLSLEKALVHPELVRGLNLVRQDLKNLPKEIQIFKNLEYLHLNMDILEILPDWILEFKALKSVQLKGNARNKVSEKTKKYLQKKEMWRNYGQLLVIN